VRVGRLFVNICKHLQYKSPIGKSVTKDRKPLL